MFLAGDHNATGRYRVQRRHGVFHSLATLYFALSQLSLLAAIQLFKRTTVNRNLTVLWIILVSYLDS